MISASAVLGAQQLQQPKQDSSVDDRRRARHEALCQQAFSEAAAVFQDGNDRFIYPQTDEDAWLRFRIDPGKRVLRRRNEEQFRREQLVEMLFKRLDVCDSIIPSAKVEVRSDQLDHHIVSPYVHFVTLEDLATELHPRVLERLAVDSEVALLELVALQPTDLRKENIGVRLSHTHPLASYSGCTFLDRQKYVPTTHKSIEALFLDLLQRPAGLNRTLTPIRSGQSEEPFLLSTLFPTFDDVKKQQFELVFYDNEYTMYESGLLLHYFANYIPDVGDKKPYPLHNAPVRCFLLDSAWAKKPLRKETLDKMQAMSNEEKMLPVLAEADFPKDRSKEKTILALKERWQRRKNYLKACEEFESAPLQKNVLNSYFSHAVIASSEKAPLQSQLQQADATDSEAMLRCKNALRRYMVPSFFSVTCSMYPLLVDIMKIKESNYFKEDSFGCYYFPLESLIHKHLRRTVHSNVFDYFPHFDAIGKAIQNSSSEANPSELLFECYTKMLQEGINIAHTAELDHIFSVIQQKVSGFWLERPYNVKDPYDF